MSQARRIVHRASRHWRRALACLPMLALAGTVAAQPGDAGGYRLVGYVAGWEKFPRIDAEKIDAISYAFAHIADGRPVLDQKGAAEFLERLRGLKKRNPKLKILVSVGGWGADGFSDAALDAAARTRFARGAAELVAREQLDGIDLDWEYPGLPGPGIGHHDADQADFTLLLRTLREQLDRLGARRNRAMGDRYLLTAALADGEFVAHVDLGGVQRYLDWIDLMTYDFHNSLTPTTGHHAALRRSATSAADERCVECAVEQYLAAGVPARKLVVGVPFYGRAFADVKAENHGLDQPYGHYAGDYSWPRLVADYIGRNGFVRYRDEEAGVPYLWNAATRTFVSYDDPTSLRLKAAFVRARGLGGMMYWEQSQDPEGVLVGVLAKALHGAGQ